MACARPSASSGRRRRLCRLPYPGLPRTLRRPMATPVLQRHKLAGGEETNEVKMSRSLATAILAIGWVLAGARLAGAAVGEVKLALQNGSNDLPLIVMQSIPNCRH